MWQPKRALLSVSDKSQIVELAQFLLSKKVEIVSTGGTAKLLSQNNIPYLPIESLTKRPEAFGGRMKSISFELASGLLYRRGHEGDERELEELGILPVDLVVCNLYPFTYNLNQNLSLEEMVELIDVGGPTMIRASAKNFEHVACLTQVVDYDRFISEWELHGGVSLNFRKSLAQKAFFLLSQYDETIALELGRRFEIHAIPQIPGETTELRYGENPQQNGWSSTFANFHFSQGSYERRQLQGKDLSYNNFLDMDQAHKCVSDLAAYLPKELNHVVIVKHGNPCGIASHPDALVALKESFACDATSAFGGIVAFSSPVDETLADWLSQHFFEVILAPSFSSEAISIFAKKKNLRLITVPLK
ncbi:MAG: hypothetical protein QE271_13780, partial [Bacteriovoracaceae bacterium]|nr:hypothetical protein [Bacteriovoracaceae bacterium]